MESDDDPVVSEMDIFLATDMRSKAFVVQFPLVSRKEGAPNIQQVLQDKSNKSYRFLVEPPDVSTSSSTLEPRPLQAYRVSTPQSYAIGLLINNQLHLTPIPQILQARPSDLDESTKNSDQYEAIDFTETTDVTHYQTASTTDIASQITPEMYKDSLTGMRLDFSHDILEQINSSTLSTRPPREQIYYMLLSERTIHFDEQLNNLQLTPYANDLMEILMKYAYYVQGRWVVKSEELSEKELPIHLRMPRNVAICVFAYKKYFPKDEARKFTQDFNLTPADLGNIFNRLGTKKDKQLIFKFKENSDFETKHHDKVVEAMKEVKKLMKSIILHKGKEVFEGLGFTEEELS